LRCSKIQDYFFNRKCRIWVLKHLKLLNFYLPTFGMKPYFFPIAVWKPIILDILQIL